MMTITGANTEQPAFNSATEKTFTRIHRRPSRRNRDTLHKQIEHVLIDISVPCFDWSGKYGLLAEETTKINYKNLTNLDYIEPGPNKPPMTDPTTCAITSDFQKKLNGMEGAPPGTQDKALLDIDRQVYFLLSIT